MKNSAFVFFDTNYFEVILLSPTILIESFDIDENVFDRIHKRAQLLKWTGFPFLIFHVNRTAKVLDVYVTIFRANVHNVS